MGGGAVERVSDGFGAGDYGFDYIDGSGSGYGDYGISGYGISDSGHAYLDGSGSGFSGFGDVSVAYFSDGEGDEGHRYVEYYDGSGYGYGGYPGGGDGDGYGAKPPTQFGREDGHSLEFGAGEPVSVDVYAGYLTVERGAITESDGTLSSQGIIRCWKP